MNKMMGIIQGLPDNVVGVNLSGTITGEDYDTVLIPAINSTSPTGSENHLSPLRFQTFNRKVF